MKVIGQGTPRNNHVSLPVEGCLVGTGALPAEECDPAMHRLPLGLEPPNAVTDPATGPTGTWVLVLFLLTLAGAGVLLII